MTNSGRHIAIVCAGAGSGGSVAAIALRHATGLADHFDVTLISDSFPRGLTSNVQRLGINPPKLRWLRRYAHAPREMAFALYARRALTWLKKSQGLDFILCHGHVAAALAAVPVAFSSGTGYGLVTHGDVFDRPRGTYDPWLTRLYKHVTPKAYARADLIIALSPHMQTLAEKGGAAKDRIRLIPNGIDARDLGLDAEYVEPPLGSALRILFVGRLAVEKGVDTLLAACRCLSDRSVPFELRLVGDGPLRKGLQRLADEFGLTERLNFLGPLPRSKLGTEYLSCHVVCVPSRSDPFPTVVLEAMAAGRPVIGADIGGIPSAITSGRSGLLVKPEQPNQLAEALVHLAGDRQSLINMGRYGHQECRKRFGWDKILHQLAEAIDDAIDRRSKSAPTGEVFA